MRRRKGAAVQILGWGVANRLKMEMLDTLLGPITRIVKHTQYSVEGVEGGGGELT